VGPLPFQFVGGALALDFINTVGNRRDIATRRDYLATPADALEWLVAAGLERDRPAAGRLSRGQLRTVAGLRECLYRIFSAVAENRPPTRGDLRRLDRVATAARAARVLTPVGDRFEWRWRRMGPWDRALFHIATDAVDLLLSDTRRLVRRCGDESCGWVFIDQSRGGRRRWCSMADCGNRAKARAHYNRQRRASG
jgi:predicted RNA-binding Zn ribbon-like protein